MKAKEKKSNQKPKLNITLHEDTKLWQKFAANDARFIYLAAKCGLYHIRPNSQSRMIRVYDSIREKKF